MIQNKWISTFRRTIPSEHECLIERVTENCKIELNKLQKLIQNSELNASNFMQMILKLLRLYRYSRLQYSSGWFILGKVSHYFRICIVNLKLFKIRREIAREGINNYKYMFIVFKIQLQQNNFSAFYLITIIVSSYNFVKWKFIWHVCKGFTENI